MRTLARRLLLALCLAVVSAAVGAQETSEPFKLQQLAPGVYAVIDQGGRAGANAGIVIGSEAVALVDSLYRPEASVALLAAVRRLTPLPLRYVLNTHHHIDHVGGNALLAEAGAVIVAQRRVAGWIHAENLRLLGGDKATPAQRERVAALRAPQQLFDERLELDLGGGRRLLLRHWPGHTGGDTVVTVSDAGVVFMGDLFWRRAVPNLIDARVADWIASLGAIAAQPGAVRRFVPGHGEVGGAAELLEFQAYLQALSRQAGAVLAQGLAADAAQAALLQRMSASHGDWAYFKGLGAANARDMLAERRGEKRVPPVQSSQQAP
ncbi:MBL fold metallo-hydrolase [Roseateles violae]|uniref:MBL fold metallo-hydrolase n=1 Tax=Roseateles violae TaxID=3058042 RepID=A0ABT8DW04_9BURK|nr:MBL fold metallo-hydrolase [Pelomonas sp. PFR6]MDN3922402.1 MBL fold metallo-hydrolase [Pelomonas sp. PFR6]